MFGGHRTYHLREQWIFKGLAALSQAEAEGRNENVFLHPDGAGQFGIGPAMVQAIRFWLLACGLIDPGAQRAPPHLTDFGKLLWRYDPYLEQLETLWLLHIHLVRNCLRVPTWFWFFHSYASPRAFDEQTCLDALHSWAIASFPEHAVKRTTLQKDLKCLLRMYDSGRQVTSPENGTASPFARLRLLAYSQDEGVRHYRLLPTDPERIHPLLLLYVLTSQQIRRRATTSHVSLTDVLYEPENAGRIFPLLTQNVLLDVLMQLREVKKAWSVSLTRHGGQEYLSLPFCSPEQILCHYYQKDTSYDFDDL